MESSDYTIAEKLLGIETCLHGQIVSREQQLVAAKLAVALFWNGWRCKGDSFCRIDHRGVKQDKQLLDEDIEKAAQEMKLSLAGTNHDLITRNVSKYLRAITILGKSKAFSLTHVSRE